MVTIGAAGVLAPGRLRWLRAVAWMSALTVAIVLVFNLVADATLRLMTWTAGLEFTTRGAAPMGDKLAAAMVGAVAILALYRAAVRIGERRPVRELELRHAPADLLIGFAIGAALMAMIVGALWLFGWVAIDAQPVSALLEAVRDSVRSGVLEELVLRLVIFRLLWRAFGIWPALVLAGCLFGALHLANPDSSAFAAVSLICGEGIGIGLYLLTSRIWAPIGMHAAWNFTQGWIFGAAVSGTSGISGGPLALRPAPGVPEVLSGGGFGPEASLAALIISLAASLAILLWAWKLGRFVAEGDDTD